MLKCRRTVPLLRMTLIKTGAIPEFHAQGLGLAKLVRVPGRSRVAFGDESYKLQVQIEGTCPMPSGRWCPQLPGSRVIDTTAAVELASLAVPTPDVADMADKSRTAPHALRARLSGTSSPGPV
jgi:hypothetical protein